ncbi:glycosyltransferase [Alloalcanivorax xenomutans]|uniref:glycosyltransferase n=1 Tax=Alloalcanivorax xenomutans TaxID=1094342 RepID=UPI00293446AB|nr:glycosyltransferase [Alloalcanivorax xenomutans]WOD30042.1 glycosyltransferase [Alloalcanivorax xenomutans]
MKKVAIFYHFIAHYRKEVFLELEKKGDYHFFADENDYTSQGIKGVGKEELRSFTKTRCIKVYKKFMWQKGVFSNSISHDYDVLIYLANPYYLSTWVSALAARMLGKKVFFWTIGWHRPLRPLRDMVKIFYYLIPSGILLYNDRNKKIMKRIPFLSKKWIFSVYNSVSGIDAGNMKERDNITELDPGYLICVTRLEKKRGIDEIIKAMKIIEDRHGWRPQLLLVGDGSERDFLVQCAQEYGVQVQFWGSSYDKEELSSLYSSAAVTVAPGMVGLTAIQSMSHGVPVITHSDNTRQAPESEAVIENETGFLFEIGNVEGLANAILKAATIYNSPEDRSKIRARCLDEVISKWSPVPQARRIHAAVTGGDDASTD